MGRIGSQVRSPIEGRTASPARDCHSAPAARRRVRAARRSDRADAAATREPPARAPRRRSGSQSAAAEAGQR